MARAWPALDIHVPGCDPQLQELVLAELDDFRPTAIQEPVETQKLRAFFTTPQSRLAAAGALAAAFGHHLYVEFVDVEDEDWATRSQATLQAITIGGLIIAPPWDLPGRGSDPRPVVVIRPSTGFGTGHHATTRLMLRALQQLAVEGRDVLDVGCGSGVLAIAAVRLGARSAVGIDTDPDAVASANENVALNCVEGQVRFREGDVEEISSPSPIVLANLTGALLETSAPKLADLIEPGGFLVVSGFLEDERRVIPALAERLIIQAIDQEDEWMCAVFRRPD